MRASVSGLVALLVLICIGPACAKLTRMSTDVCGNSVVDLGEDCDSHSAYPGATCGAVGSLAPCRYVCSSTASCPSGWGCGEDHICRKASGRFEQQATFDATAKILMSGDFEGDGRVLLVALSDDDALGRRFARFLDPDSDLQIGNAQIPAPVAFPVIADLDSSSTAADLAFADLRGVAVMRGNGAATTDFISFPSVLFDQADTHLRAIPMDVIPSQPGDEVVVWRDLGPKGTTLLRPAGNGLPEAVLVSLPFGEDRLAGRLEWARFDERPGTPCAQIVVPYTQVSSVEMFTPCKAQGNDVTWNVGGATRKISLPGGARVETGVLVGDVDGDGHLDLLIGTKDSTFAALGNGDGTFHPPGSSFPLDTAGEWTLPAAASSQVLPLAIGDLNGDNVIDYVVPTGIIVSGPGGAYTMAAANLAGTWDDAVIADFNGNGLPDVVGASSGELDLDFLNNAGQDVYNHTSIITHGPPRQLAVGDFDGDLLPDLAFAEPRAGEFGWSVAFGAAAGAPTEVRQMGTLASVDEIASANLPDISGVDGMSDLVMVAEDPATKADSLIYSLGRGERAMLAPFALHQASETDLPLDLAAGHFMDDAAGKPRTDLGLVAVDAKGTLRLWYLNPIRASASNDVIRSGPLPSDFHADEGTPGSTFRYGAHVAAGDFDRDGYDELALIAPFGADPAKSALVIGRVERKSRKWTLSSPKPIDLHSTVYTPVAALDVDGDGRLDLVVKPGDDSPTPILVYWSNGGSSFNTKDPTALDPDGEGLYDFTCVPEVKGCQLYVVSEGALYRVDFDAARKPEFTALTGMPGGVGITNGDFDNDGLFDLAVTDESSVYVLHSTPVLP